jgi:hypothetical protein
VKCIGNRRGTLIDETNTSTAGGQPMTGLDYEIRVTGLVPADVLVEIEDVRVAIQPVGTILRGAVVDQAALHGVINRLQGLGLELVEVRRLVDGPARSCAHQGESHE